MANWTEQLANEEKARIAKERQRKDKIIDNQSFLKR